MTAEIIFVTLAALCALTYLRLTGLPSAHALGGLRSTSKTAAVALLALAAGLGGAPQLLVLALAACALGDLCLSRDGAPAFRAGIAAFALGHLAYIALFLSQANSNPAQLLQSPQALLIFVLLAVGLMMARLLAPRAGALRLPVLGYIPVILGMGVAALTLPAGTAWLAAAVFILSDLILATETFVLTPNHTARRLTPYAIWLFYWSAQAGFFATFA